MVYVIQLASRIRAFRPDPARKLSANLYDIYRCCVYSEKLLMMGQRNCPKRVEFYSKNKFEKLVHLVGFIITIYHDARSPNVRFSQFVCSGSPVLEGSGYTECKIVQLICNLFTFILYKLLPVGILNSCLSGTFVRSQRPAIRTLTFLV